MPALFGRQVVLEIGPDGGTGKVFKDLRVRFNVKMSQSGDPNTATIKLWNASSASRAMATADGALVRLSVGYETPQLLFTGRPIAGGVKFERSGVDTLLALECQDGGEELSTNLSLSFGTDISSEEVLDTILKATKLARGVLNINPVNFVGGMVLQGTANFLLKQLAQSSGQNIFVRDGALTVLGFGESTGEPAPLFSAEAGNLIGTPIARDAGQLEIRALLGGAEALRPGKPFRVESAEHTGNYAALDVVFTGDSGFDKPFYVETTGEPL